MKTILSSSTTSAMRIALYGGSFDPVHLGHLLVAQAVREEAGVERVMFIPAAQSPFKPERKLSPDHARLAMLRLALAGLPWAEVDAQELQRGGVSFTIDTVRSYRTASPTSSLLYVIGADHVPHLMKWRDAEELAASLEFLVIPRPGEPELSFPAPFRGRYLQGFPIRLSASEIRERARSNKGLSHLVPDQVAEYISKEKLYDGSL